MHNSFHDRVFGNLHWSAKCWKGTVQFLGRQLPLLIDFDIIDPSDEEKRIALESSRNVYPLLNEEWEQNARLDAARQVTEAAYCQTDHVPADEDVQQVLNDMNLESLDLTYSSDDAAVFPYLAYSCPNCFPDMRICIQFSTRLTIDEVTINEKPSAKA
jgi:hypothetical protein